jgi:hypothetical protein
MKSVVRQFVESVHKNDFAFVYYSGHGMEVGGTNYLLPIDLPANASAGEVEDDAVSAQRIASELDDRGAAVKVIVLDACRDNPIKGSRSAGGGLAPMEGLGSLIVFATEAGRTASDNSASRNGLFTRYLLKALTARGVSLDDAVRDVARQMASDTNRQQVPAIYGLLEAPVFLVTGPVTVNVSPAQPEPDAALEAWNAIKDTHNPQDFDDFITAFPQSPYAASARLVANRLRRESTASSQPKPPNPEVSRRSASEGPSTLVVSCDLACSWSVDGIAQGTIQPGDATRTQVAPGDHMLIATTSDGRDRTSQNITGAANTSKVVALALKPVREERTVLAKTEETQGETYSSQKDYAHALAAFQEACTGGDSTGCFGIGYMYDSGTGVNQDYEKAAKFFKQSCDLGKMMGCKFLGYIYGAGLGVPMDYAKTFALYKQACDGGEPQGCQYLGSMYFDGVGVAQSYSIALSLFKQACDGNNLEGCDYQGDMYKRGESVPVDLDKARQLYDQACKGGLDLGCKNLKALTDAGSGKPVTSSPQPAANIPSAAAKAAAERGMSFFNEKDYVHALPAFQEACSGGEPASCSRVGRMYIVGDGVIRDPKKAFDFVRKGCDLGDMVGCEDVAWMYQYSQGVTQNYALAFSLFKQACDGKEAHGCFSMARFYQWGQSVPVDLERARQLYDQACKGGVDEGCKSLEALDAK